MKSGADGIDRDQIAALIGAIQIDRLDDKQFFTAETWIFLRGHYGAQNASNNHRTVVSGQWSVFSNTDFSVHWPPTTCPLIS